MADSLDCGPDEADLQDDPTSVEEARQACDDLQRFVDDPSLIGDQSLTADPEFTRMYEVLDAFDNASDRPVRKVLREHGLEPLRRLAELYLSSPAFEVSDLLHMLQVLMAYPNAEAVPILAEAARAERLNGQPRLQGSEHATLSIPSLPHMVSIPRLSGQHWLRVFNQIPLDHPHLAAIVESLRDPLPRHLAGAAFLGLCNDAVGAGALADHPFATADGLGLLAEWLSRKYYTDQTPEHERFAQIHPGVFAAEAIPMMPPEHHVELIELGLSQYEPGIRQCTQDVAEALGMNRK